jgi:ribonucleoside-triphosphate reductase
MQAPTLVEVKDGEIKKYVNASNIKRFAEENCLTV